MRTLITAVPGVLGVASDAGPGVVLASRRDAELPPSVGSSEGRGAESSAAALAFDSAFFRFSSASRALFWASLSEDDMTGDALTAHQPLPPPPHTQPSGLLGSRHSRAALDANGANRPSTTTPWHQDIPQCSIIRRHELAYVVCIATAVPTNQPRHWHCVEYSKQQASESESLMKELVPPPQSCVSCLPCSNLASLLPKSSMRKHLHCCLGCCAYGRLS